MATSSHTIQLSTQTYTRLLAAAKEQQTDVEVLIKRWLGSLESAEKQADKPNETFAYLASIAEDLGVDDLSENHDHYLYGVDKE